MKPERQRRLMPALRTIALGTAAAVLAAVLILWEPSFLLRAREQANDLVSQIGPLVPTPGIVVIDIDEASERALGPWPWPRTLTAKLIRAVAEGKPAAIGLDIVLAGRCGRQDPGNAALAEAIGLAPLSLGAVIPGLEPAPPPLAAIAVTPPVALPGLWRSDGIELPCPDFIARAAGLSIVSLAGDASALVRSVPGLAAVGQDMLPGLAADTVRLSEGAGTLLLSGGRDPRLALGSLRIPLGAGGEIRFRASGPEDWASRTLSAHAVLRAPPRLNGKIVLIGASLPQLGNLRPTAASPLAPSTQIMADAAGGILNGRVPWRPAIASGMEALAALLGSALALLATLRLRPAQAALAIAAVAVTLMIGVALLHHAWSLVFDPLFPAAGVLATGLAAGLSQFSATRASESAIRMSFEQRLPAAVVARLAEGRSLSMEREERVVTALFTDIEGFTSLTSSAGSRTLVALLDGYYDGVTRIVARHGGMVDKIVGDAVHAFFNMPSPLEGHERKALDCAEAIVAFTREYQTRPEAALHGFGRTRIGIETGLAMVGDVGAAGKFDYSAHGASVNLAARLQDANKRTGTSILAGPGIRAAAPQGWAFDSLGQLELAGFGLVEVFSPRRTD